MSPSFLAVALLSFAAAAPSSAQPTARLSAPETALQTPAPVGEKPAAQKPAGQTPAPASPTPGETPAAPKAVDRISVLGASLSEGFGLEPEIGAPVWLGTLIDVAVRPEHRAAQRRSNLLFFIEPRGAATQAVKDALVDEPTLVVALDFLFWFAYGTVDAPEKRAENFEFGLKQLESFQCPVLVGDLPDMSSALDGDPQMLLPKQVPPRDVLDSLNKRLREWAKPRANVVVFGLNELNARLRENREYQVRGNIYFPSELQDLFQSDKLHPTVSGTIAVWLAAADALVNARKDVLASWFVWDRAELYRKLYGAKVVEREQRKLEKQKAVERAVPPQPRTPPADSAGDAERKKRGESGESGG
jgi:hypothetical protein